MWSIKRRTDPARIRLRARQGRATPDLGRNIAATQQEAPGLVASADRSEDMHSRLATLVESDLSRVSADYASLRQYFLAQREALTNLTARNLRDALNAHIASLPKDSYEQKRQLATWLNTELRSLGVAIRCPKTGLPTYLRAHIGREPTVGRFRLDYWDGSVRQHPASFNELPPFEFIAAEQSPPIGRHR